MSKKSEERGNNSGGCAIAIMVFIFLLIIVFDLRGVHEANKYREDCYYTNNLFKIKSYKNCDDVVDAYWDSTIIWKHLFR